jgi:hypothetical protein
VGWLDELRADVDAGRASPYQLAASPADADMIVILESVTVKSHDYATRLLADDVFRRNSDRCVTINYEDDPPGFLAGIYASLPPPRFDEQVHRAWGYLFPDPFFLPFFERRSQYQPSVLYTFRGSFSHPVRNKLFAALESDPHARMTRTYGWYDHSDEVKRAYIEELMASSFVLCPRGIGTCSHRLMEVMASGRCPVIISDAWVPPVSIPWDTFSIRVSEAEVERIPELLRARQSEATQLGAIARRVWEQRFAPGSRTKAALDELSIVLSGVPLASSDEYRRRWTSRSFLTANGWTSRQRVVRSAKRPLRALKRRVMVAIGHTR